MNKINTLTKLLGIKYPILQGAMAWIADADLAAAVSNAGGLGIIAAGNAPAEYVEEQIKRARQKTDKPFGVNIMLLSPSVAEVAQMVADMGVSVVTTGAGNPGAYIQTWKNAGIKVVPVVPSCAYAARMQKLGAHAVIAEGMEAGGHIGQLTTMPMIPQIVDCVDIPVIAAGGIADGRGVAAAFMLGASGVQLGTRFLVAKECNVHENYKQRILKAADTDTVITGTVTGHPVRVLKNKLARKFKQLEAAGASKEEIEALGADTLRRAVVEGDMDFGSIMAGQSAGLVQKEQTVQEMLDELMEQTKQIVANGAALWA